MTEQPLPPMDKLAFETLANFRYEIRKFLRFSENVTRKAGITPLALVSRCEKQGFVERRRSTDDRRRIEVRLLPKGEDYVERLANAHRVQLIALNGKFSVPVAATFDRP